MQTKLTPADLITLALCLALALGLLAGLLLSPATEDATLVITDHATGREWTYPLDTDCTLELEAGGHRLTVTIENGRASVTGADCPDGLCMAGGSIGKAGQTLVCVPAGLTLHIRGEEEVDADAIIG